MMKILFVDDDAITRKTASAKINWTDLGYQFLTPADNGLDALDIIRKELPDIIICDIRMPGMDGIQMAEIAKNYSPDLEFIFLSGYREFEYAKQALQLNAVDYLTKPFDTAQLIAVVKKAEELITVKRKEQAITSEKYPLIQRKYLSQLLASNFSHADDEVFKAFDFNISGGCGIVIFAELKSINSETTLLHSPASDVCDFLTRRHPGCFFIPMENQEIFKTMLSQLREWQAKSLRMQPDAVLLQNRISELMKQNHSLARLQAKGCIDSAVFIERSQYNRKQAEELGWKLRRFRKSDQTELVRKETQRLLALFEEADPLLEFSPAVFQSLVRQITVYPKKFCFQLTNGLVLEERRGRT